MRISIKNLTNAPMSFPLQALYRGIAKKQENWQFPIPEGKPSKFEYYFDDGRIIGSACDGYAFMMTSSIESMENFAHAYIWQTELSLMPKKTATVYFSLHIGP